MEKKGKTFYSHITTNWIDPNNSSATSDQKINFVGDKGRFFSDQKNRGIFTVSDKENSSHINPYFTNLNSADNYFYDGYGIKNIKNFIINVKKNNVTNLKIINSSFFDSIHSTKVIEAVNKSLIKKSQAVYIK